MGPRGEGGLKMGNRTSRDNACLEMENGTSRGFWMRESRLGEQKECPRGLKGNLRTESGPYALEEEVRTSRPGSYQKRARGTFDIKWIEVLGISLVKVWAPRGVSQDLKGQRSS